jgi:hypothetical protein
MRERVLIYADTDGAPDYFPGGDFTGFQGHPDGFLKYHMHTIEP